MVKKSSEGLKRARKAQNQHRSSKEQEKLKLKANAQNQPKITKSTLSLTLSMQSLPPLDSNLSCLFSQPPD
jgi:hypothetical protein